MKAEHIVLGLVAGLMILNSCNDDMGLVGSSMQPDSDISKIYVDSFRIEASTVLIDSLYAKTSTGLLGEIYDPLYGNLKSDYICQFYAEEGFKFARTPYEGKIDSIALKLYYARGYQGGWIGDSLAAMTATVYPVINPLERIYYTNTDPTKYADMHNPLARQTYTARNLAVSDSAYNDVTTDMYGNSSYTYQTVLTIHLPQELGQKFYDEATNHPESFKDQDSFNRFFPGVYITTTFGSGNILSVISTELELYYKFEGKTSEGNDTIYSGYPNGGYERFPVTKEVIQMNRLTNTDIDHLLEPSDDYTYLKTPAGVFTRITIPAKALSGKIKDRNVNDLAFTLTAMPQENWKYALTPPSYLLLIPEDSLSSFFENGSVENNKTIFASYQYERNTYATSYTIIPYTYTFGNISALIKDQAEKDPDNDINMLVIPVTREIGTDYYGSPTGVSTSVQHYLSPSGVKLRKDPAVMKMRMVTSTIPKVR